MTLYELRLDNVTTCKVQADVPDWLPVKPRVHPEFVKMLINNALNIYFQKKNRLQCN